MSGTAADPDGNSSSDIDEELEAELSKLEAISEEEIRRVQEQLIAADGLDFTRRWSSLEAVEEAEDLRDDAASLELPGAQAEELAVQSEARKALGQLQLLLADEADGNLLGDGPSETSREDFSSSLSDGSIGETTSEAWKMFHARRKDREDKLEEYSKSMAEGKKLALEVKATANVLVQSLASNEWTSQVLEQADEAAPETDGDRKLKYLKEMQEMQEMQRKAEEERRRRRQEESEARQKALEDAERIRLQREAAMREEQERAEREIEEHRRNLEAQMRANEEKILRERRQAEQELKRALELQKQEEEILISMKNARLEMKKKEEEVEMNRSRRSTDWHKELVKKQEEVRIETQRKAANEKKQDLQLRNHSASVLQAAACRRLASVAHCERVSSCKLVTACARRWLARQEYLLALLQLQASRVARELQHSERDAQEAWRSRHACAAFRTVKDVVITRWSMQRRRMRRSKLAEEEEEEGSAGDLELSCLRPCWTLQTELRSDLKHLSNLRAARHDNWIQRECRTLEEEEEKEEEEDLVSSSPDQRDMSSDFLSALDMQYGPVDHGRITKIELNVEELKSLEGAQCCTSLTSLSVNVNRLSCLDPLRPLSRLRHLQARENQLSSLSCLQDLRRLVSVRADVNRISELKGLAQLANLRTLELQNNNISLLSGDDLRGCSSLERLVLYRNQISAVQGMGDMPQLLHLNLGRNELSAVEGLDGCRRLEVLIMYENKILSFPETLPSMFLREIWLNGNKISALPAFPFLPFLQSLHLGDNQISHLPPLYGVGASLSLLDLSFNRVLRLHSLLSLLPCVSLARVRFNDNPVAELAGYLPLLCVCLPGLQEVDHHPMAAADLHRYCMLALRADSSVLLHLRRHGVLGLHYKAAMAAVLCRHGDEVSVDHRAILSSNLRRECEIMETWVQDKEEGGAGRQQNLRHVLLRRNNLVGLRQQLIAQRERLFQKQRREERALESSLRSSNRMRYSSRQVDALQELHAQQVYQLHDRQVKLLRDKSQLSHSGTFTRSKAYERRMQDAADLRRLLAAARLQAVARRTWTLSRHRGGCEAEAAARVVQAHVRRRGCRRMAQVGSSCRVLSAAAKRAITRRRLFAAISMRHDDLEDEMEEEEEEFWRAAPMDIDAFMAPDLNSTRLEDIGSIQELKQGARESTGQSGEGREDAEEIKRRIAELSQVVKDKRNGGASRRELQPVVDELLQYKQRWSELESSNQVVVHRQGEGERGAGGSFGNLPPIHQERVGAFEISEAQLSMLNRHAGVEREGDSGEEREQEGGEREPDQSPSKKKNKQKDHTAVMEDEYRVTNKKAEEIAAEWGFSNVKSAELMLRKRMKYQKLAREKEKRETLLDPEHRLARFKRVMAASSSHPSHATPKRPERREEGAPAMVPVNEAFLPSPQHAPARPASQDAVPARPHQRHVRSRIAQAPRASLATFQFDTSRSSDGVNQLMEFQTEQLNNKLLRGSRLNNATARAGSSGSSGSSKNESRSIPQLRVNNFFL